MAPIKALCRERASDWSKKFQQLVCYVACLVSCLKSKALNVQGLTCVELTGDSEVFSFQHLKSANIILTTPEKWDSMTRKWKDNQKFILSVGLMLIDEVCKYGCWLLVPRQLGSSAQR